METQLNGIRKKTLDINEHNKELEIQLDRMKALSSVEKMAKSQTHLVNASEQIELKIAPQSISLPERLPSIQKDEHLAYGY
jgi:hypothetical protein